MVTWLHVIDQIILLKIDQIGFFDRSDNLVEDNPFLLPEKMRFPSNQQANLFCHELTHGVGRSGSRKKM